MAQYLFHTKKAHSLASSWYAHLSQVCYLRSENTWNRKTGTPGRGTHKTSCLSFSEPLPVSRGPALDRVHHWQHWWPIPVRLARQERYG